MPEYKPNSQKYLILRHLTTFGSITPLEALREYGIFRLAARINELREGTEIETVPVEHINKFGDPVRHAKYVLVRAGS